MSGPGRTAGSRGLLAVVGVLSAGAVLAFTAAAPIEARPGSGEVDPDMVLRGRKLVIEYGCGGCHGGMGNPAAADWLVGLTSPAQQFPIGSCADGPDAEGCFLTRPRNLTPHPTTGLGRFSERQIFNALRFGLRPGETADVEITSHTPGQGNFPENPKYLAPPMPWPAWRHLPDDDLWAIAHYLKNGLRPQENRVEDSEGPMDFWASAYTVENIGSYPAPAFPTAREKEPPSGTDRARVVRGRQLVIQHDCGGCHLGGPDPTSEMYLTGVPSDDFAFPVGPCLEDPGGDAPCWMQRARNLTPDDETGTGRYTERQLFNALRYGLRPSGTPDVEITESTFPSSPDYLGPGMPWHEFRHMDDRDIRDIVYYLKHGVRPVSNAVADTDRPDEGWAGEYTPEKIGTYPAPPFPTAREVPLEASGGQR